MVANAVTLSELRTRVRYIADAENADNLADVNLNTRINAAYRELYESVSRANPTRYYASLAAVTVAGTATIALPTDMLFLRSVAIYAGTPIIGQTITFPAGAVLEQIERASDNEVYQYASGESWARRLPRYIEEQYNLRFVPPPESVYGVEIRYVPVPAALIDPTEAAPGVSLEAWNGWDDWIVYRVAIEYAIKEERDISALASLFSRAEQRIRGAAGARDNGRPLQITDVRSERQRRQYWRRA